MRMNLGDLLRNKMVAKVASSREQVETIIKVAERDLKAAKDNLANGYADGLSILDIMLCCKLHAH